MLSATYYKLFLITVIGLVMLNACKPDRQVTTGQASANNLIRIQIAEGNRIAEINSDSLKVITQKLYDLYKSTHSDSALVYADFFESTYNWNNARYQQAMQLAIKALANAQSASLKDDLPKIYLLIASIENELTDYTLAFETIQQGFDVAAKNRDTTSIIALEGLKGMLKGSEGVGKKNDDLIDESLAISNGALKMADANSKYQWLSTRQLNSIGQCYTYKKQYALAVPYFEKAIALATKYDQRLSLIRAYCRLGEVLYYLGKKAEGIAYIQKSVVLTRQKSEPYWLTETAAALFRCYAFSKDYRQALFYQMERQKVTDSLEALENVRHIGELQIKYEATKRNKEIAELNAKNKLETILLYAAAIVLILLCVIAVLFYNKQTKEKKLLLAEKALLDDELRAAELELSAFTEHIKDKNKLLEEFKTQIEHLQLQNIDQQEFENMEQLLKVHIMTNESWERFKKLFEKVHPGFLNDIKNKVSPEANLTAADTRILALMKLQLSNTEMANVAGITVEGIKKSKQRLRKKLGLNAVESLSKFVESI